MLVQYNLFIVATTGLEMCQIIKYSIYQTVPLLTLVLTGNFSLCFFLPYVVNNPVLYATIMILWLVALPGFLIMSSVYIIVNIISLVMTAAPSYLFLVLWKPF